MESKSSRLTRLLNNLRAALVESAGESEKANKALAEIRETGLSVYLVIDDPDSGEEPEALRLIPPAAKEGGLKPDFRIDQADLTILRGLGIDPTRTLRRGRQARRR